MNDSKLKISVLQDTFAICWMDKDAQIPAWVFTSSFFSITRTADELSIVCSQIAVTEGIKCDKGWRCLKVEGPLDFSLTGILVSLATPLAQAGISIFVVSTYDTDYLLVKEKDIERATLILSQEENIEIPLMKGFWVGDTGFAERRA
jgi:hypothetical protein